MRSIVKKINPFKLSEIADRIKEKPLSLKEIVKDVHAYRGVISGYKNRTGGAHLNSAAVFNVTVSS